MAANLTTAEKTPQSGRAMEWDLAAQWQVAWRVLKWSISALVVLGFLLVIGQGFLFYQMFAEVHWGLGAAFIILLSMVMALLIGRPLASFLSTPVIAKAPDGPADPASPRIADLVSRLKYDLKYLAALKKNPGLTAEREPIAQDIETGRALLAKIRRAGADDIPSLVIALTAFENDHIEARLSALNAEVDRLIHAEAVAVGVATAISMNGTVDAFIVLWRNANLVSKISRLYFGRPHLMGSLRILRDVAAIVVLSRALEDITDMTGDVIGGLLGRMGGLVAGPVMDGAVNAMMTLKLGYLAKNRCRSFEAWTPDRAERISARALARVKKESASVASDLLKRCGGLTARAANATTLAMDGSKSAWAIVQSWFGTKPAETPG
ncbi:MAG: DUF697 domain-containing protein [Pseudomonadota bacterium]